MMGDSNEEGPPANMVLANQAHVQDDLDDAMVTSPGVPSCSVYNNLPQNMLPGRRRQQNPGSDSEDSGMEESVVRVSRREIERPSRNALAPHSGPPLFNWQATKPSLKDRFSYMFNNEVLSDVHFLVGREPLRQRIPAHKLVLTAGSAVFDAMFNGTLATTAPEIELPDVEPAAFLALLRFLYSDEIHIGPETVMTTLYTAKKYAVPTLERHCVDFLKRNLRADNAFMLLTQARLFDEPQLASLCLDTIDKNTSEAVSADGFTDVDQETLIAVLERDTLHITETKLYQAVIRWGEARCQRHQVPVTPENLRSVLDSVLSLIRFPLMGLDEFAHGPAQSGILTDREIVSLFLYFTVNPKPSLRFRDTPRCLLIGTKMVNRFLQQDVRWGYNGITDRIGFAVNRRIFVVGLGLYGTIHGHGPSEYEVTIEIVLHSTNRICSSNSTRVTSDGTCSVYKVMFEEPIKIRPHTIYLASAKIKGPDTIYGTKGQKKVEVDCGNDGAVVFQFSYAAGHNNGTSVEDGQIPEILFYLD